MMTAAPATCGNWRGPIRRGRAAAAIAAIVLVALALLPGRGAAQGTGLNAELANMRELRAGGKLLDASDYADRDALRQALEAAADAGLTEIALWEVADVHLAAANQWPSSPDNAYARRAIDAWSAYVDYALERGLEARLHRAVEYLQRSYLQAAAYTEMYVAYAQIPPSYVNDKVVTRWEDRLRTCPAYGQPRAQAWMEGACMQAGCRDAVAEFHAFVRIWLDEFPLRTDAKRRFAARADRIPPACRGT